MEGDKCSWQQHEAVSSGRVCKSCELLLRIRLSWILALHIVHVIVNLVNQAVTAATISEAS